MAEGKLKSANSKLAKAQSELDTVTLFCNFVKIRAVLQLVLRFRADLLKIPGCSAYGHGLFCFCV